MSTPHEMHYDQDLCDPRMADEPPQRRVGTCARCGHGVYAWVLAAGREVIQPCDCDQDEDHDDPEPTP